MYAIVENGSKQYRVEVGTVVKFEKLNAEVGSKVEFPVIMVSDDKGIKLGASAKKFVVVGEVLETARDKKIIVFKYKAKKNERKKQGHRQYFTKVRIIEISAPTKTAKAKTEEEAK